MTLTPICPLAGTAYIRRRLPITRHGRVEQRPRPDSEARAQALLALRFRTSHEVGNHEAPLCRVGGSGPGQASYDPAI